MERKKLSLKKKVIASLSEAQKAKIIGGNDDYTTSFSGCTGFLCCDDRGCETQFTCAETSCGVTCYDTCAATCADTCAPLCTSTVPICGVTFTPPCP